MRKIELNKNTLTVYDSIDELPIVNFSRYNKFLLIDSGVGGTLEDIDAKIDTVIRLVQVDQQKALNELTNMRQALYFINQGVNPSNLAFAALIKEVNGTYVANTSDDILTELLVNLREAKQAEVDAILDDIKKKLESELSLFFPELANNPHQSEVFALLKKKIAATLDNIINNTANFEEINKVEVEFTRMINPKVFVGKDSAELRYIKDYEKACIVISKETGLKSKDMTVLQFYLALDQIKKDQPTNTSKRNGRRPN